MNNVTASPALIAWLAFGLAFAFGADRQPRELLHHGRGDRRRARRRLAAHAHVAAGDRRRHRRCGGARGRRARSISARRSTRRRAWRGYRASSAGFLFGFGMTLASGCGSKTLIRIGGGNLKSLVVLVVLAISAYMTLKGLFAVLRVNALDPFRFDTAAFGAARSDLPSVIAALSGRWRCDPYRRRARARRRGRRVRAREPRLPSLGYDDRRRHRNRRDHRRWLVRVRASGLCRRGSEDARGSVHRDQFGQGGVVFLRRADGLSARTPAAVERSIPDCHVRRRRRAGHAGRVRRHGPGDAAASAGKGLPRSKIWSTIWPEGC